jgi:hypothetical protein
MRNNLLPRLKTVSLTSLIHPRATCAALLKVEGKPSRQELSESPGPPRRGATS